VYRTDAVEGVQEPDLVGLELVGRAGSLDDLKSHNHAAGDLLGVGLRVGEDGFAGDDDEFWRAVITVPGGDDPVEVDVGGGVGRV